jgi:hypothetical protein
VVSQKRKKVLIITYYWPPAGGPGVQRVLKFVKYLPDFGWEPIVLTVRNGEYPAMDESLLSEVPDAVKVYKTKTIEFFNLFKFFTNKKKTENIETFILEGRVKGFSKRIFAWIRANIFLPDARIGWNLFAVKTAVQIIKDDNIEAIYSSSPPHSVQLIAGAVKKKSNLPWLADLRDPWVDAFWESSLKRNFFSKKLVLRMEKKLFLNSDHITVVSKGMKEAFENKFDSTNISIIHNGFDHSDFINLNKRQNEKIEIIYTGSMASSQNPLNLFRALSKLSNEEQDKVRLRIFGSVDDSIQQELNHLDLSKIVKIESYIPHNEVVQVMKNADLLLLLIPHNRPDILTGKLFEYIGTQNPILCIGPNGEASEIVNNNTIGHHYNYKQDLSKFTKNLISNESTPKSIEEVNLNLQESKFTRRNLTGKLAKKLDKICQ